MARQDRLMRLLAALRRLPSPVTAERLATETEISQRQLYRDIATLRAGGVLIDGAAGYGYTLTEDPSRLETEALMLAVGSLDQLGDERLARAGRDAMARIIATLPDRLARQSMHAIMRSWRMPEDRPAIAVDVDMLRQACWDETSVVIAYRDRQERQSTREILPLGLSYSPTTLMLVGWCLLREDYRTFEVARMERIDPGATSFRPRRAEMLRRYQAMRMAEWEAQKAAEREFVESPPPATNPSAG